MEVFKTKPNFKIIKKIGSGSFGSVYKVLDINNNKNFAIKRIEINDENKENIIIVEKEANILKELKSENIVKYIDCFWEEESFNIIMEFCEYNDLRSYINNFRKKNELIPESIIRIIIAELSNGIKEIHSKNVIHRDLKPENIFISNDYKIKIGDFGISKILDGTNYAQTFAGTYFYMAPEIINYNKYTNKVDIWSLGCILYELCTLKKCFDSNNIIQLAKLINSGIHGKIDLNYYNRYLQNIIDLSLEINEKKRLSITEIRNLISKELTIEQIKKLNIKSIDKLGFSMMVQSVSNEKGSSELKWSDFIKNMLLNKIYNDHIYNNILSAAALFGLDGTLWASTTNLSNNKIDINAIKEIFSNKANSIKSITLNNKIYEITNINEGFSIDFKADINGGTIARTNLGFVIGIYDQTLYYRIDGEKKNQNSDICKLTVEDLAKQLIKLNY